MWKAISASLPANPILNMTHISLYFPPTDANMDLSAEMCNFDMQNRYIFYILHK